MTTRSPSTTIVCSTDQVGPDRGIAAIVGGDPVAIFRVAATAERPETWHAVSHVDPRAQVPVMARGLIGSRDGEAYVASPLLKERYSLETGAGLDNELALSVWTVAIVDGAVHVTDR